MNNRRTADAARAQANFARVGSLVHNNGEKLGEDSIKYLEALRHEAYAWIEEIERELHRLAPPIRRFGGTLVLCCGIVWSGPKLTPQQAADILRPNQTVIYKCGAECVGPRSVGTLTPPPAAPLPDRRLDGSLLTSPPWVMHSHYDDHYRHDHRR